MADTRPQQITDDQTEDTDAIIEILSQLDDGRE